MTFTDVTSKFDDGLHALDLALDHLIKVLLLDFGEGQEVDGADVAGLGVLGDEFPEALVDALGQERRVGGLQFEHQHYGRSWQTDMLHAPLSDTT